jgi:hypothetical protein
MASSPSSQSDQPSRNPFLNPSKSNNPFLRPRSSNPSPVSLPVVLPGDGPSLPGLVASKDPESSKATIAPETLPPASVQTFSSQSLPSGSGMSDAEVVNATIPVERTNDLTDDEALQAGIRASLAGVEYAPPPGPPPSLPPRSATSRIGVNDASSTTQSLTATPSSPIEAPPAYTPNPNLYQGETTIGAGRGVRPPLATPFGSAPYPGSGYFPYSNQSMQSAVPPGRSFGNGSSPTSGPATWDPDVVTDAFRAPGSYPDTPSGGYDPPPGPPPLPNNRPQTVNSFAGLGDGSPTMTPTPGRPLIHEGRVLVYPAGYTCYKCEL